MTHPPNQTRQDLDPSAQDQHGPDQGLIQTWNPAMGLQLPTQPAQPPLFMSAAPRCTYLGAKANRALRQVRSPAAAAEGPDLRRMCQAPGRPMAPETGEPAPSIGPTLRRISNTKASRFSQTSWYMALQMVEASGLA